MGGFLRVETAFVRALGLLALPALLGRFLQLVRDGPRFVRSADARADRRDGRAWERGPQVDDFGGRVDSRDGAGHGFRSLDAARLALPGLDRAGRVQWMKFAVALRQAYEPAFVILDRETIPSLIFWLFADFSG